MVAVIFAGMASLMTTITTLIISIRNGKKVDAGTDKLKEVHKLVDGNLSEVKNTLRASTKRIADLETLLLRLVGKTTEPGPASSLEDVVKEKTDAADLGAKQNPSEVTEPPAP